MLLLLVACEPPPPASEPFNDAAIAALAAFEEPTLDTLPRAIEQLEDEIAADLDLSGDVTVRSLTPQRLAAADVADMDGPDRDPEAAVPVALASLSPHALSGHDAIVQLPDQTALEPFALSYSRSFLEGEACYPDGCAWLRTDNVMEKANPSMTVTFGLRKDWRVVELSDGRQARLARGWMQQGATEDDGADRIEQSYALELWSAQDDGQTLRLLVLWAETVFDPPKSDDEVVFATRVGMEMLFDNHDAWITQNP